jgi:hypothetical protein
LRAPTIRQTSFIELVNKEMSRTSANFPDFLLDGNMVTYVHCSGNAAELRRVAMGQPDLRAPVVEPSQAPKLLDQVRDLARAKGHSEPSVASFVSWTRDFIVFHQKRHPREMGRAEIARYLEHLVQQAKEPLSALAASRAALGFLYGQVLHLELGELPCPQPPRLLDQVRQVLRVRHYSPRTEQIKGDAALFRGPCASPGRLASNAIP